MIFVFIRPVALARVTAIFAVLVVAAGARARAGAHGFGLVVSIFLAAVVVSIWTSTAAPAKAVWSD